MSATASEHLEKTADHYDEASKCFREAAQREAKQHDNETDHLVRLGASHAAHALEHADEAAKEHATGVTQKCCCS